MARASGRSQGGAYLAWKEKRDGPDFVYDPLNVEEITFRDSSGVQLIAGNAYVAGAGSTGVAAGDLTFNGQPTTKLVSTNGSTEFVDKTGTWDLSAYEFLDLWVHISGSDNYLDSATSTVGIFCGTTGFTSFYNARLQSRARPSFDGWRHLRVHKAQFDFTSGTPSWANIQAIRVRWEAGDGTSGTVHLGPLRAGKHAKSAIRMYFDDGHASVHTYALPAMRERGLVGTAGIVTSFIGQTAGYMTWSQVRDLADAGWDIVSHTHTHPNLTTQTEAQIRSELSQAQSALVAQGYRKGARCLICPQGGYNNTVDRIAREYHDVVRGGAAPQPSGIPTETYPAWHPRDMRYYSVANTDTPASVITKINDTITAGGVTSPVWHVLTSGAAVGALEYNAADFITVLDHIATKRNAGQLDVRLMTEPWFRQ